MQLTTENIILIGSVLLLISILAGKTSYKFGVPTLLFFLFVGIMAGSEGIGKINFNNPTIAQFIGIVALNFILFSGGLDTDYRTIKPVLWRGVVLSTLGVLITAVLVGLFVWQVAGFTLYEGLLVGGIVSSTDAAAVFSILRSRSVALKSGLRPTLELESGSNDPMAYFLTVVFTLLVMNPDNGILSIIPLFFSQIIVGAVMGFVFGFLSKIFINKIQLDYEGLYPVLLMALMFITFSVTDFIGGNGFLAIYLLGVYLGNQKIVHRRAMMKVFDGLAWLMQIVLFLTLGLLVFPSHILPVVGVGLLTAGFLILVARPISVFVSLYFFPVRTRKKWFISWVGLRGAVPIVFATYPMLAGVEKADMIFNIVFFISVTSVLIQGTTLNMVAKLLHVAVPEKAKSKTRIDIERMDTQMNYLFNYIIPADNITVGRKIVDLDFPRTANINLIERNGKYILPNGNTILQNGDKLMIVADNKTALDEVKLCLQILD